MFVHLMPQFGV